MLIKEVKELANKLNRTSFGRDFPHKNQVARLFGSWQNFLIAEEFPHHSIATHRSGRWNKFLEAAKATPTKKYSKLSDEQFIEDIQLLAKQLNRRPVFRDYPKAKVATDRFKFLEIAGIKKENQKE